MKKKMNVLFPHRYHRAIQKPFSQVSNSQQPSQRKAAKNQARMSQINSIGNTVGNPTKWGFMLEKTGQNFSGQP